MPVSSSRPRPTPPRRHRRRRPATSGPLLAVLAVLALVAAACGDDDGDATAGDTTSTTIATVAPDTDGTDPAGTGDPAVELVDTGLRLDSPIAMTDLPDSELLLVAERAGVVRAVRAEGDALEVVGDPVVDIRDLVGSTEAERGLLGLATDAEGEHLYLSYTDADGASRLDELPLERGGAAPTADTDDRRELLQVEQPFGNHNGGHVVRAPDGSLLLGLGDGGAADDPGGRAQDPDTLLGKLVRVDPGQDPPEVGIHALGVRNPWRFSFDRDTGDLWVADVGQDRYEEVTLLPAEDGAGRGANLGWDLFEGTEPFPDADPDPRTSDGPFVDPLFTYGRDAGCSITGGVVYRGEEIPALDGWYLFGDFCTPAIRALRPPPDDPAADGRGEWEPMDLGVELDGTVSFAQDADGEVHVISLDGQVARLVPAGS